MLAVQAVVANPLGVPEGVRRCAEPNRALVHYLGLARDPPRAELEEQFAWIPAERLSRPPSNLQARFSSPSQMLHPQRPDKPRGPLTLAFYPFS